MNILFWLIIILLFILLWFLLAFIYVPIGKLFKKIWDNAKDSINYKEEKENENVSKFFT